jgi:hypothetical protein
MRAFTAVLPALLLLAACDDTSTGPADAICVTQGDATAVFSVQLGGGSSSSLTLHTTGEGRHASASGFTLTLVRLDPYPYASRPISPSDYRALLRVDPAFDR